MIINDDSDFTDQIRTPEFTEEIVGPDAGDLMPDRWPSTEPTPAWTEEIEEK